MAETYPNQKTADLSSLPSFEEETPQGATQAAPQGAPAPQGAAPAPQVAPQGIPQIDEELNYDMNYEPADQPTYGGQAQPAQTGAQPAQPVQPAGAQQPAGVGAAAGAQQQPQQQYTNSGATGTHSIPPVDEEFRPCNQGAPVISLKNVTKIYPAQPNKPALDNVNIDVYAGEFVFLVGHSGSGKSTFIRMLTRELKPTTGTVRVAGQDLNSMRDWKVPYLRRNIGCVFQDFKLLPKKTAYENVAFALECIGKSKHVIRTQVPEVLRLVGLEDKMNAYPDELSGGEQQRVSVARAFVNRPPLLVCDEPTGNLDPAISLGIMKLLERINRTGTTVVVATHDREMVDSMRRRVVALENGHIVRDEENGGYGCYGAF